MIIESTTTYFISIYHHEWCELESSSLPGIIDKTVYDKVRQWLAACRWFSPVSSTNKIDRHDITEVLLKVSLNIIILTLTSESTPISLTLHYSDTYLITHHNTSKTCAFKLKYEKIISNIKAIHNNGLCKTCFFQQYSR
jgi:hypothetical protein